MNRSQKLIIGLICSFILYEIIVRKWNPNSNETTLKCNLSTITTKELENFLKVKQFPNGIPKIIHYNYKDYKVPLQYITLVEKCMKLNRDVLFVFWTDKTALKFVKEYHPTILPIYESYLPSKEALKKSDFLRFLILTTYGGVYMDMDTKCQKAMETVMHNDSCFLSKEADVQAQIIWGVKYMVANSLMACVPGHRFFKSLIYNMKKDDDSHIMRSTGPIFLTETFDKYQKLNSNSSQWRDPMIFISIQTSDLFSPKIESFLEGKCSKPSVELQIKACRDLVQYRKVEEQKIENAVVVHLFYHLGYEFAKGNIKELFDISLVKDIKAVI